MKAWETAPTKESIRAAEIAQWQERRQAERDCPGLRIGADGRVLREAQA